MKTNKHSTLIVFDLGSYSIKVLVGRLSDKGITVKQAFTIPISSNLYMNGDIQNIADLSDVLKDFVTDNGVKGHPLVITFSSMSSITRVIDVPMLKSSELGEVVEYEMQQYLPTDVSLYITKYKIMSEPSSKDGHQKVMVGTIPKTLAENFWSLALQCDLNPIALDINTNALSKLIEKASGFNGNKHLKEENIALIEVGHTLMDISVFEKGEFQFTRRIQIGGQNIDQRIERLLEISTDQARMEKHNPIDINQDVFDYTDENRVFNSLKSGVDEWISEIEKVFKFYATRKAGNRLDRCYLYGGGASIKGIATYFASALDVKTEVIRHVDGVTVGSNFDNSQMCLFINALGALIRKEEQ